MSSVKAKVSWNYFSTYTYKTNLTMNYRYIIIFSFFFSSNLKFTNIQFLSKSKITKDFFQCIKEIPHNFYIFSKSFQVSRLYNMHGLDRLVEIILCFLILYKNSNDKNRYVDFYYLVSQHLTNILF